MDTGGAGYGGLFQGMGEATSNYFDKLDKYSQEAEQKRQFDVSQAQAKTQIDQNQQKLDMERFDRLGKNVETMRSDYEVKAPYLTDEQRTAYSNYLDNFQGAVTSYWGSPNGDQTGFNAFSQQYGLDAQGKPKAWGTTLDGSPINFDSINADYFKNKPIKDVKDNLTKTLGAATATMLSSFVLDPRHHTPEDTAALQRIVDNPSMDIASMMSTIVAADAAGGVSRLVNGLRDSDFSPASLALAENVLKTFDPKTFTLPGGDLLPNYQLIMSEIAKNRGAIDTYRKGTAITQGGAIVQQFENQSVSNERAVFEFDRVKKDTSLADGKTVQLMVDEGASTFAASVTGKEIYMRVNPGASEEDYQGFVAASQNIRGMKDKLAQYNVTMTGDAATQSKIATDTAQITFDAIKPYIGENAELAQLLTKATTGNGLTQAQFTAELLPQLLPLQGKQQLLGILGGLAEMKGGAGLATLKGALASGLVDQSTYDGLAGYSQSLEDLRKQGVNVDTVTNKAAYYTAAMKVMTSRALIDMGVPELEAKGAKGTALASIASSTVTTLMNQGAAGTAFKVGQQGSAAQLADFALKIADDQLKQAEIAGSIQFATPLARQTALTALQTAVAGGLQAQYSSAFTTGQMPYAGRVGALTGQSAYEDLSLRYKQAAATISLIPLATDAQKSAYTTAIAQGDFDTAINQLKLSDINWQYAASNAGAITALAQMDTKGALTSSIKDPALRGVYQSSVDGFNAQRAAEDALKRYQIDHSGPNAGDPATARVKLLNTSINTDTGILNGLRNSPAVSNAKKLIAEKFKGTVAVDAMTGLYKIVIPGKVDAASQNIIAEQQKILDASSVQEKVVQDRINKNSIEKQRLLDGGTPTPGTTGGNTGGASPYPNGNSGRAAINTDNAQQWALANPEIAGVPSDCAAIVSRYYNEHGIAIPMSNSSAQLEQNAIGAGFTPYKGTKPPIGTLIVYTGSKYGLDKQGGVGKHVVTVVGYDANGKPMVLENPGLQSNGTQGITRVTSMYPPAGDGKVAYYAPPPEKGTNAFASTPPPTSVVKNPPAPAPTSSTIGIKSPASVAFRQNSDAAAREAGVDARGFLAFLGQESSFGGNATGTIHVGIGQIGQQAQDQVNKVYGLNLNRNNPADNIRIAAYYYKYAQTLTGSSDPTVIYAAYHDGPERIAARVKANGGKLDFSTVSAEAQVGAQGVLNYYNPGAKLPVGAAPVTRTAPTAAVAVKAPYTGPVIPTTTIKATTDKYNPQQLQYLQSNPVFGQAIGKPAGQQLTSASRLAAQFLYDQKLIPTPNPTSADFAGSTINKFTPKQKALLEATRNDIYNMVRATAASTTPNFSSGLDPVLHIPTALTKDQTFISISDPNASPAKRQAGATTLAFQYMQKTGQVPNFAPYYNSDGSVGGVTANGYKRPLTPTEGQNLARLVNQIRGAADIAQPPAPPLAPGHTTANQLIPSLANIPGTPAVNRQRILDLIPQLNSVTGVDENAKNQAIASKIFAFADSVFAPLSDTPANARLKQNVIQEIGKYYLQTRGGK